ncbi:MAG: hypothetical protein R6W76_18975, partial [Caldilinea sp.]
MRTDQPRLQRLLVYLLLHRRHPRPRQQIAFTLWADINEKQALKNLRTLLTRLRQTVPELGQYVEVVLLEHKRLGIWLQPGGHIDPDETP